MHLPRVTRRRAILCLVILGLIIVNMLGCYILKINAMKNLPMVRNGKVEPMECPPIHVAMVATGLVESRHLYFTVKSVLMHRSSPLHFHFITDDRAETVLRSMLSSWLVPGISHDLDQATGATDSLTHCSKVLHLYMNLHLILPESVHCVVVLEPTSVVKTDIAELWSETNHSITLCREDCVTHCHNVTALQYTQLGILNLNLSRTRHSQQTQMEESMYQCKLSSVGTIYALTDNSMSTENCTQINFCSESLYNSQTSDMCQLVQEYDGNLLRYREVKECTMKPLVEKNASPKGILQSVFVGESDT